jgi:ACS family glucarate transporter-like MFS transporter
VFSALTAFISPRLSFALYVLIGVRFLLGAGEAIMFPAANLFVSRWIPAQEQGIANGLVFAGVGVGAGVTPALIAYIMVHFGWRWSFWTSAIIGILAGVFWFLVARDSPEEHPLVSPAELTHIRTLPTDQRGAENQNSVTAIHETVGWRAIFASKEVWALTLAYFSFGYVAWIFFTWFFIYLAKVRGLDLKASAFYSTLPFLAMAICSPLGGAIADWLTRRVGQRIGRCGISVIGLLLASLFLVLGADTSNARVASLVLAGGAGALYLSQSSFWAITAGISRGSSGSVSGLMNTGGQFGGMLTAQLTPILALRWNWSASFYVAAAFAAAGAVAWLFVDPARTLAASDSLSPKSRV